jgi:signal transduction histidine kinase
MTRPATILNVDDYLPGRYARSRVLRDAGFNVIEAASGEEALRLVRERLPDVVLLDNNLPDIPGMDVCRLIKAAPETEAIPVLQLSATSRALETKIEAMSKGADTYLTEPIAPAELVAHVRAALRWRQAEEGLRESNTRIAALYEEARLANQAKDDFLALLSHELRTPLNAMFGWIQLLRSGRLTPEQREHGLETIERSANAQARLIEDLLDVSRIVSGQLSISSEPVNLVPIVRAALESVRPQVEAKGMTLRTELPDGEACVNGDPSRLQQITTNLLSNAIKFTEKGTITATLSCRDGRVRLEVRDTGVGIDPEFVPFVFDRFRQADSSKTRPHGGLGLGLAIARHLVEAHGGRITVESGGHGMGTIFAVDLPQLDAENARHGPDASVEEHATDRPLGGVKLLLVEDDEDSREMMTMLLEHSGANVITARHAMMALEMLEREPVDVMLADVGLPQMDGYALVGRIRSNGLTIPAVALTGYASASDRAQAIEAGFNDHLGKPVSPDELVKVLARVARSRPAGA